MEIKIEKEEAGELLKKYLESEMPDKKITVKETYTQFTFNVEEIELKTRKEANPVGSGKEGDE